MKKNLLTVLILALLVVNLILTGIIMFSTISANQKTVALVNDIATILNLEVGDQGNKDAAAENTEVSIEDTEVYDIADSMTIGLKNGADGESHYAIVEVSLSVNKKDKKYKEFKPMLSTNESLIKSEVIDAFGSYTKEEAESNLRMIQDDILSRIQQMFDSQFVFDVSFRNINFQ
ncbi:MAG: flagellar basal body-associated protein FliL [Clostridia bacterium]|nr:flagellar basal body-associated protein FliL [Clostridia bacterium]